MVSGVARPRLFDMKAWHRPIGVSVAALVLAACSSGAPADPSCQFPPGTPLAFSGETTLTALGLDHLGPVEAHDQVGRIYVSASRLVHDAQLPGEGPSRMYCGIYGQQQVSEVIGPVPEGWQPPKS
jgi:hypothetical protein